MKSSRRSQHRKKKRKMKSSKNQPTRTPIALMLAAMASKPLTDRRGTTTIVRNNSAPTRPRPAMAPTKAPSSSLILLRVGSRPRAALSTRSVRGLDATKAKATEAAEIAHTTGLVALERVILKAAKARNRTTKGAVAEAAEAASRRLPKRAKEINKSN
jgi:hypothetical protein